MKRSKKTICSLLLTVCMMMQSMCSPLWAGAADPVQTEGTVSVEIYHEHGPEQSGCYEDVYHPCGGKVVLTHDAGSYQIFTCQNCMHSWRGPHPDIHDGYYKRERTCTADLAGSFYIERMTDGKKVYLAAGLINLSDVIDDYSIEWGEEGEYVSGRNKVLPLRRRGTFKATLTFHDKKLDQEFTKELEFTDLTAVLHVEYRNEGELTAEMDVDYGMGLEDVTPPVKTGYDFCGYYCGDKRYYDENGKPADYGLEPIMDLELVLEARWKAAEYPFYYGSDADGDGRPDKQGFLTYDAAPPDIDIGEVAMRPGYYLDGYYIGDTKVYDADGSALGIWKTVPGETPLILKERWIQKKYVLRYGSDADGNGIPDKSVTLVYGDSLPALEPPAAKDGYVFDGYYYGGRQIYNGSGKPVSELPELFENEECSLESGWHIKHYVLYYGADRNGDGVPDGRVELDHGSAIPDLDIGLLEQKTGYSFSGFSLKGIGICNGLGKGAGVFRPSFAEGSYILEPAWSPMSFVLYYGPDSDEDGRPDRSAVVVYDSMPPVLEIPDASARRGYRFDGYLLGNRKLFDKNGKALGKWNIIPKEGEDVLRESWKGVRITLRYGEDKDGDGAPDSRAEFAYGDMIPDLGLGEPAPRKGYVFKGYYVEDVMIYGAGGHPQGSWLHFDEEKEYILLQKWQVKDYDVKYGKDEDGDGAPDGILKVTYGDETYADVEVPQLKENEIFDGYFLEEDMVFDKEGKSMGIWRWDVDEPVLRLKSHTAKTSVKPGGEEEENGNTEENDGEESNTNGEGEEGGNTGGEGGSTGDGSASGNGIGDGGEGSVSGNGSGSSSENSVSGNSGGQHVITDPSRRNGRKTADSTQEAAAEADAAAGEEAFYGTDSPAPTVGEEGMPVLTEDEETALSGGETGADEEATEAIGTESRQDKKIEEKKADAAIPVIKRVAKAGAVTVGGIGSVLAVYAGLVYVLAMAEVDTIRPDGSRKRLCKLSIQSEKGKAFMIRLGSSLQEKCETDRLCLKLPLLFALRYKDHTIIVQSRGKSQEKRIGREIFISI